MNLLTNNVRPEGCEARIMRRLRGRLVDFERLITASCDDAANDDGETLAEYGLCFDYVPPLTFGDQKSKAIAICAACSLPAHLPSSVMPSSTAPSIGPGLRH